MKELEDITIKIWRTGNSTTNFKEGYTIHCGIYSGESKVHGYTNREDQVRGLILSTLNRYLDDFEKD